MQPYSTSLQQNALLSSGRSNQRGLLALGIPVEAGLNVLLLMYFALNGILHLPENLAKPVGNLATAIFWIGMTIAIYRNRARVHWELWTCRLGFAFLMYTVLSAIWGTAPLINCIYPAITAVLTFFYYNYLIERFSLNDFARMMAYSLGALLALSIIAAIAAPSFGLDNGSSDPNNLGAWQGVFGQKNQLGIATALAVAVAIGMRLKSNVDRVLRVVILFVAIICAYGSQSREAWLAIALQLGAMVAIWMLVKIEPRSRFPLLLIALAACTCIGLIIYYNLDSSLALIGRSRTASGRLGIWNDSLLLIKRRPWFGYGTYGVWRTSVAWLVVVREGWNVPSSHNNYIEILLYYGILGMVLYLSILLSAFFGIFRSLISVELKNVQVPIYVMIALLGLSLAAPLIVYYPAIGMLMLLYCVSRLEQVNFV
jgi:exopolysaccharide production protein ExoQ